MCEQYHIHLVACIQYIIPCQVSPLRYITQLCQHSFLAGHFPHFATEKTRFREAGIVDLLERFVVLVHVQPADAPQVVVLEVDGAAGIVGAAVIDAARRVNVGEEWSVALFEGIAGTADAKAGAQGDAGALVRGGGHARQSQHNQNYGL